MAYGQEPLTFDLVLGGLLFCPYKLFMIAVYYPLREKWQDRQIRNLRAELADVRRQIEEHRSKAKAA